MSTISRLYNFVLGTVIDSEQVDAELDQLVNKINGSIDYDNLSTDSKNRFMKLLSVADRKEAFGVDDNGGATWGLSAERTFNIPHGLGTTPTNVQLTGETANSTASTEDPTVVSLVSADATNIRVKQRTIYGGNCNFPGAPVHWRAIA